MWTRKSRQNRTGGIEYRPSAKLSLNQPIDGHLRSRTATHNRHQPPARLKLIEQDGRNGFSRAIEDNHIVRSPRWPAISQWPLYDRHIVGTNTGEILPG